MTIEVMDLAKGLSTVALAKGVFSTVSIALTMLGVSSAFRFGLIDCRLNASRTS